ncbi:hypothetical protein COOONC_20951 [Cooperia oncophora]
MTPFWEDLNNDHADDAIIKNAARRMLVAVDINGDDVDPDMLKDFQAKVVERVRGEPLYCNTPACMSNDRKTVGTGTT